MQIYPIIFQISCRGGYYPPVAVPCSDSIAPPAKTLHGYGRMISAPTPNMIPYRKRAHLSQRCALTLIHFPDLPVPFPSAAFYPACKKSAPVVGCALSFIHFPDLPVPFPSAASYPAWKKDPVLHTCPGGVLWCGGGTAFFSTGGPFHGCRR